MVKINYRITVPAGLDKIPAPTMEVATYREEIMTWCLANGMVDRSIVETPTVRDLTYTWIDQNAIDNFATQFGQGYIDYYNAMVAEIEAIPGSIIKTIEII